MGLKDELEARLSTSDWAHEAEELYEGWAQLAEQDLHTVLGQFLGVAFKAIGALCEAVVEIGGHIDDLEARRDW
jgi:hypothetical protein